MVEFEKWPVERQYFRKSIDHFRGICRIYITWTDIGKPKYHNMEPVGLGNTKILTDYAQKSPRTLALWLLDVGVVTNSIHFLLEIGGWEDAVFFFLIWPLDVASVDKVTLVLQLQLLCTWKNLCSTWDGFEIRIVKWRLKQRGKCLVIELKDGRQIQRWLSSWPKRVADKWRHDSDVATGVNYRVASSPR